MLLRTNNVAGAFTLKPKKDAAKQHFEDQKVSSQDRLPLGTYLLLLYAYSASAQAM